MTEEKDCEVLRKTGGHYYTEGGSKMCCEEQPKEMIKNLAVACAKADSIKKEKWGDRFKKMFMYERPNNVLEFDILKAGNIGKLIDFIRETIKTEREQAVKEERERISKALPKRKIRIIRGSELNEYGKLCYNQCLEEVKKIIN
jgi:hypothetical protein